MTDQPTHDPRTPSPIIGAMAALGMTDSMVSLLLDVDTDEVGRWRDGAPLPPARFAYGSSGSRLFSNSGVGCQALRHVPAGSTVLSAVGAVPSA